MHIQRYPDGAHAWCWFIWSRHPQGSITWTHSLSLDCARPGLYERWFNFNTGSNGLFGFYLRVWRFTLRLERQKPMYRPVPQ